MSVDYASPLETFAWRMVFTDVHSFSKSLAETCAYFNVLSKSMHNRGGGKRMTDWLATGKMWNDILAMGAPLVEKILRPVVVYFFLVTALRVFGKRELAQLNPFDLVVLLSLSNTVQNAIIGNDNSLTGGLVGALALLAMNYLVVRFLFGHRRLDQIFEGQPTVLIER